MIGFANQEAMLDQLTEALLDPHTHKSWNLAIPPGFNAEWVPDDLVRRLQRHSEKPLVAKVSADGLLCPADLVRRLHYQWSLSEAIETPPHHDDPQIMLSYLLYSVDHRKKKIQIITEFHKILSHLDEHILVALRDAEQAGRLQTVTISVYPYRWIKEMWKAEGSLLHVSLYGDSHKLWEVEPCSIQEVLQQCCDKGLPGALVNMAYGWTGGYPEQFEAVIDKWCQLGRPSLTPDIQQVLRQEAERTMERMVRLLDREGESRFRDRVVHVHLRTDDGTCYSDIKRFHPWKSVLLDDHGLRADCLGDAAVTYEIEQAFSKGTEGANAFANLERAVEYYNSGRYEIALRLVEKVIPKPYPPAAELLHMHARIMAATGGRLGTKPVIDSDWRMTKALVSEARRLLERLGLAQRLNIIITERYDDLDHLADAVLGVAKIGQVRIVDALAGLSGVAADHQTAFTLLVLQAESGRCVPGNSAACKAVLELPEQILRVWAFWALGLNYYQVPDGHEAVWAAVQQNWPRNMGELRVPAPGQPFGGIPLFAFFTHFVCMLGLGTGRVPSLWDDIKVLQRDLQLFSARNDAAHATTLMDAALRKTYFDLIDRWMTRLESDCRTRGIVREKALSAIQPLPLMAGAVA